MGKLSIAVVIPTIRDLTFLRSWKNEFKECIGIIVEDRAIKQVRTPTRYFAKTYHYDWTDIDRELGDKSWIISRRNAAIRCYGFLKAYQMGVDYIITLDDDCYPVKGQSFVKEHIQNLSLYAPEGWYPTFPHRDHLYTRGFPYSVRNKREVVLSHGLWTNIIDDDAQTQIKHMNLRIPKLLPFIQFIPTNYLFPMSSMNLAFKRKITPYMYFPLMGYDNKGKKWPYDRFDDIWAGIFMKKIIDKKGYSVTNGSPFVEHRRASNVYENLKKEKAGIKMNEKISDLSFNKGKKIIFTKVEKKYFNLLQKANIIWKNLLQK